MLQKKRIEILIILTLLALILAACTGLASPAVSESSPAQEEAPSPTLSAEVVNHVVALAKMEGHLRVSLANWEDDDRQLAGLHAAHPVAELWAIVADELEEQGAASSLKEALDTYAALTNESESPEEVKAAHQAVLDAIVSAEQALAGDQLEQPAFQGEVIRKLLEGVEEEYAEAVSQGQIAELEEYQDALGFLTVAKERYAAIETTVKAAYPRGYEEIEEKFAELEQAFPGVTPPAQPADPGQVEEAVHEIAAELGEAFELGEAVAQTSAEIIAGIRDKVSRALEEYAEGETDEAYELAAGAYLDGFEHVEGDLLQQGEQELMETVELQFKDLRDGIKAGQSRDELQALADQINANLDKVEEVLE
jgi:hypothetical protein